MRSISKMMLAGLMVAAAFTTAVRAQGVDIPQPIVTAEEVEAGIKAQVDAIWGMMDAKRYWEIDLDALPADQRAAQERYWGGRTALAVLALLYAGEDPRSDRMETILKWLSEIDMKATYITGIRASVWSKLKDARYRPLLARDAQTLMDSTMRQGKPSGWFGYMPGAGGDHSNTQYGVLGLRDAAIRGVEIPRDYWEAIQQHMIDTQAANGGWAYQVTPGPPDDQTYGSMTVACLANMYIALDRLNMGYEGGFNGTSAKFCGRIRQPDAIDKGLGWLDRNLPVDLGLAQGGDAQVRRQHGVNLYYLYGLERCANASGRKNIGGLNWFQQGAKWVLARGRGDVCAHAWALLFLSKGQAPIFYNKLDTHADWNNDLRDIPNLSDYIGDKLETKVNWQVIDVNDPVAEWLDAPVLFMNGHDIPRFTDEQKKALRLYTDSGGTLLAEACCSKDEFTRGFKQLARELWPEWELQMVTREHPVFAFHYDIKGKTPRMMHINDGCRSRVFLVMEDMSCAWNQRAEGRFPAYFELGMNLARYASDHATLRSRLRYAPRIAEEFARAGKLLPPPAPGEIKMVIADWPTDGKRITDIRGMRHLAETMREVFNVQLEVRTIQDNKLDDLDGVQVLHLSGHFGFVPGDENIAKVKSFIARGGLVWADPQCGRDAFKEAFDTFLAKALPDVKRTAVPNTDALVSGKGLALEGFDVSKVRYKYALKFNEFLPRLEEARQDGRRILVYSPCDITCGLDGHDCPGCRGPERNDALKIASNILLSVMPAASGSAPAAETTAAGTSTTPTPGDSPDTGPAPGMGGEASTDMPAWGNSRSRDFGR